MGQLYSKYKIFHFKNKIDSLPQNIAGIKAPLHIRIKPTNACTHNCWYCAYKADNLGLGEDMNQRDHIPKDKILEIISDIDEMGVKAVTFSGGGEPFNYPHLLTAIKKLAQTPVQFASLTNGSRLKGEMAEIFAHHGTWIRVSIDGWDDKSYAKYRGIKEGVFTKLMNNMENFKKLGGERYLSAVLVVDNENFSHVYEFVSRLKNVGVDSIKISGCITSEDGKIANEYHKPIFQNVRQQIKRVIDELSDEAFEVFDAYHELDSKFTKKYHWCPYLQILPIIGADLNVYSCQDKAYHDNGILGSLKKQRFRDFWFSDKNNFFKINPTNHCNHHCVANLKNQMIIDYLNVDKKHLGFV